MDTLKQKDMGVWENEEGHRFREMVSGELTPISMVHRQGEGREK